MTTDRTPPIREFQRGMEAFVSGLADVADTLIAQPTFSNMYDGNPAKARAALADLTPQARNRVRQAAASLAAMADEIIMEGKP